MPDSNPVACCILIWCDCLTITRLLLQKKLLPRRRYHSILAYSKAFEVVTKIESAINDFFKCIWDFFSKNYLRQISVLGTNMNKIQKNPKSPLKNLFGQTTSNRVFWVAILDFGVKQLFCFPNTEKQSWISIICFLLL